MVGQEQSSAVQQAQLVLITGGARSGKSTFAEKIAGESGRSVVMVATALASDDDMRERITRHKAARPASWRTVEEPVHLAQAVQHAASLADVVIVDCITTWLGNWLFARQGENIDDAAILHTHECAAVLQAIDELLAVIAVLPVNKAVLIVTNEVGLGIVPAYALGRVYRDMLGIVNQRLARRATHVYLLVAGIGIDVKQLEERPKIW